MTARVSTGGFVQVNLLGKGGMHKELSLPIECVWRVFVVQMCVRSLTRTKTRMTTN